MKKSQARSVVAWAWRNSPQLRPDLDGEGSMPWRFKMAQTLEGASWIPYYPETRLHR